MNSDSKDSLGEVVINMDSLVEPTSKKGEPSRDSRVVQETEAEPLWVKLTKDGMVAVPSEYDQKGLYMVPFKDEVDFAKQRFRRLAVEPFSGLASLNVLHYRLALQEMEAKVTKNMGVMDDEQLRSLRQTLREYCMPSLLNLFFLHPTKQSPLRGKKKDAAIKEAREINHLSSLRRDGKIDLFPPEEPSDGFQDHLSNAIYHLLFPITLLWQLILLLRSLGRNTSGDDINDTQSDWTEDPSDKGIGVYP